MIDVICCYVPASALLSSGICSFIHLPLHKYFIRMMPFEKQPFASSSFYFFRKNSFIACWLPFFIHYIARPFVDKDSIWMNQILEQFLLWLGWMNSAINPFIYAFYNGDFRIAFFRLTFKICYRNQQNNVFKWRRTKGQTQCAGRKWTGNFIMEKRKDSRAQSSMNCSFKSTFPTKESSKRNASKSTKTKYSWARVSNLLLHHRCCRRAQTTTEKSFSGKAFPLRVLRKSLCQRAGRKLSFSQSYDLCRLAPES